MLTEQVPQGRTFVSSEDMELTLAALGLCPSGMLLVDAAPAQAETADEAAPSEALPRKDGLMIELDDGLRPALLSWFAATRTQVQSSRRFRYMPPRMSMLSCLRPMARYRAIFGSPPIRLWLGHLICPHSRIAGPHLLLTLPRAKCLAAPRF